MSDLISIFVKIALLIALAGQLPRATAFMAIGFIRVQQRGLGSLGEFSRALQEGRPVKK